MKYMMIAVVCLASLVVVMSFTEPPPQARAQGDISAKGSSQKSSADRVLAEPTKDDDGPLGKVRIAPLPGGVMGTGGSEQQVRRTMEIIQQLDHAENKGRFQIAAWAFGHHERGLGQSGFYVVDTATGEVWRADGNGIPHKAMKSPLSTE